MATELHWREELDMIVRLMRELSLQTDPQAAAKLYGEGVRKGFTYSDAWLAVSRRDLPQPQYRITRSTTWDEEIDPWRQKDRLPLFSTGLLGELLYSNEPAIIDDLPSRLAADDPAASYFRDMKMLISLPTYDNGQALNMSVMLVRDPSKFPMHRIPFMVWQSNLFGRSTLNLVLRQQLQAAYDALDRELMIVGDIQRSLLPPALPQIPTLTVAAHYRTSRRAGGDYYDFFALPDGKWGMFLADVSGHGTPAAVVMAITHAIAHSFPGPSMPPGVLLEYVNRKLTSRYTGEFGTFVTAFYGVYDPAARTLAYACAGHHMPRLRRESKIIPLPGASGLPLGIEADESYPVANFTLRPGDLLALYTDGITETFGPQRELFGQDRLDQVLALDGHTAESMVRTVLSALERFAGDSPPTDDQTLLVIRVE